VCGEQHFQTFEQVPKLTSCVLNMEESRYIYAHKHCTNHRNELLASDTCGCFYCLSTFSPAKIDEWIDEDAAGVGQTALCPVCGIDTVLGSKANYPLTPEFLGKMRLYWFESVAPLE
jgi:hypothetical protein